MRTAASRGRAGSFADRDKDTIGFAVNDQRFSFTVDAPTLLAATFGGGRLQ